MRDLTSVVEMLQNNKVILDKSFYDRQAELIHSNQKKFSERSRFSQVDQALLKTPFSI